MSGLWRGTWATQARIATGLILFVYILFHFLNIGLGLVSADVADAFQDLRLTVTRTYVGTAVLYGALAAHAALSIGKLVNSGRFSRKPADLLQIVLGLIIPLLLASHVIFTRGAALQYDTNDTLSYLAGLIWNTTDGWLQAGLLVITWVHGCIGLHIWLRMTAIWQRNLVWLAALAALVPAIAIAGFVTEGRRARALLTHVDDDTRYDFMDWVNWPGPGEFSSLTDQSDRLFSAVVALLALALLGFVIRRVWRPGQSLKITYVDGPTVSCAPGMTLLEISQSAGVPHTALCGGRGRCTTCRVIVEGGAGDLPQPTDAEARALKAVKAPPGARLACQLRPTQPATVYRMFAPDGQTKRQHASQGKEAQLAILFLDMRGFTARTTGQLPYDVVFLLNRFFDAIVPAINSAGGTVDKYLGDGLLAVFELPTPKASARAGLQAVRGIGDALAAFNTKLDAEGAERVRIGLSLHLGTLVLGEIGAAGQAPRTLIGDSVNAASRLEAETKALGVEALISLSVLRAAGATLPPEGLTTVHLRGVAEPIAALPVPSLAAFSPDLAAEA